MRFVPFVLKLAFLVMHLSAGESGASKDSVDAIDQDSDEVSMEGLEGLDTSGRRRVIRILDSLQVPFTELKGAQWKRRDNTYLVILTDAKGGERDLKHSVYGFDVSRREVRLLAAPDFPFGFSFDSYDRIAGFDFAPYRMSPKEFAFGIRYARNCRYATGEASLSGVILFRINASAIEEIANIPTSYESNLKDLCEEDEEEGTCRLELKETAVIQVTNRKTSGYFDWIKKSDSGKSVRLAWNGRGYALKGKDPFPVEEYHVFGGCGP